MTFDELKYAFNTRELQEKQVHLESGISEGLTTNEKTNKKKKLGKPKNKTKIFKCFHCYKEILKKIALKKETNPKIQETKVEIQL